MDRKVLPRKFPQRPGKRRKSDATNIAPKIDLDESQRNNEQHNEPPFDEPHVKSEF
jgi:hypothetical protein